MSEKKEQIWRIWARLQGVTTAFFLLTGGIINLFYPNLWIGVMAIIMSVIVTLFEYPAPFMSFLGVAFSNLIVRAVMYFAFCVPCFFEAPTFCPGMFLACTGMTYIVASVKGERWEMKKSSPGRIGV